MQCLLKVYRFAESLEPHLWRVLARGYRYCEIWKEEDDGTLLCRTDAEPDVFHRLVMRARCEKKSRERGRVFLTEEEAENRSLARAILGDEVMAWGVVRDVPDDCRA